MDTKYTNQVDAENTYLVEGDEKVYVIHEEALDYNSIGNYTVDDYYTLPDDIRVELIDGFFYDMALPTTIHQRIATEISRQTDNFIINNHGECMVFGAPVDVQLDNDDRTIVQPDMTIVCDKSKDNGVRIVGAPDFVLEVISPSTAKKDYILKLKKYKNAGVREYWILDAYKEKITIYYFEKSDNPVVCGLNEKQSIRIYQGKLWIDFTRIREWIREK